MTIASCEGMIPLMKEALKDRLARLVKESGKSARSISLAAGLNQSAVRDIMRGSSRQPGAETLGAIAGELGVSITQLLGFEGNVHRGMPPSSNKEQGRSSENSPNKAFLIREYDVGASAGHGAAPPELDGQGETPILAEWSMPIEMILAHTMPNSRLAVVRVEGDSMEPEYLPGDRVMVDLSRTIPSPPGVFVVWDGVGLVLKRVELVIGAPPRRLRLSSINPAYLPYEVSAEEVLISGRVIGKWMWR